MSSPKKSRNVNFFRAACKGINLAEGQDTPAWFDRQHGYTPKKAKGGDAKRQRSKK